MISKVTSRRARRTFQTPSPGRASTSLRTKVWKRPSKSGSRVSGARNRENERGALVRRSKPGQRSFDFARGVGIALRARGNETCAEPLFGHVALPGLDEHRSAHEVHRHVSLVELSQLLKRGERV